MLVHLRLNVPTAVVDRVHQVLVEHPGTTNLTVHPGASVRPAGDLVECDVVRESADTVLGLLGDTGLSETGGIVVSTPTSTPFAAASRLEEQVPGDPDDAVLWDSVLEEARAASRPAVSFHLFLVLATVLAAIAVVTDSAILVIGAMVVGPEFGTVAAIATGVVLRDPGLSWRAVRLLVTGFALAVALVGLLALLAEVTGLVSSEMVSRPRPQTGFIWHPDRWAFIVALVAGAAGVLAMTTDKSRAMIGVFIAVTTVPAAGNLALALGTWTVPEMRGSVAQLVINLVGMVLSGTVVLLVQRILAERVEPVRARLRGTQPRR
jgi:uncharacterized hydrophobic protein (TIGR00271 family)